MNRIMDHSSELNCDLSRLSAVTPRSANLIHFSKAAYEAKTNESKINFHVILGIVSFSRNIHSPAQYNTEACLIIVQQDATVFSLLYFCRQLCMFQVLTPVIRSSYNCNCSFWLLSGLEVSNTTNV